MSKTSQRKLSMYSLGKREALKYKRWNPNYKWKCKEYMRGWNSVDNRRKEMKFQLVLFTTVIITIFISSLIFWSLK